MFTEIHIIGVVNKFIVIMKELSIEEKAKAYDGNYKTYTELINRLEDVKNAIKKQNYGIAMDMLYKPYPAFQITTSNELKESEGDKIKKDIIQCVKYSGDNFIPFYKSTVGDMISYLEKQGEQNPLWSEEDDKMYNSLTEFEKAVKQVMEEAIECGDTHNLKADADMLLRLVQKPWSEENEKMIRALVSMCDVWATSNQFYPKENKEMEAVKTWLKSLRPQKQWKPSEEQITWLYRAADDADKDSRKKQILNELLSDLKKLMEE